MEKKTKRLVMNDLNPFEGYRVASPYGWRIHPIGGDRRFHTGIDLVKEHQAPIYAFTAGDVLFAGWGAKGSGFGDYGNVVAIRDEKGCLHCYCHLDSIAVKAGTKAERGQMIGRQGNTGVSAGSHLHYEVRRKSSPSYGWIDDAENRAYEPTQYLIDYFKQEPYAKPNPSAKPAASAVDDVSAWAREAREWAVAEGITDGTRPKDPVTREEVWTMLWRARK